MRKWRLAIWLAAAGCMVGLPAIARDADTFGDRGRRPAGGDALMAQLHYNNQQEIALGRLGARLGRDPAVRKLGERIARDYERFDQTLARIAGRRGVDLAQPALRPPRAVVQEHQELPRLSGRDFDQQFLRTVIDDERTVVSTTLQNARPAQLTELQVGMEKTVPVHRDTAEDLLRAQAWASGAPVPQSPVPMAPQ